MVADSYSSTLGYLVQGTGNNNNNWGEKANDSVFTVFERAIAGRTATATTGGVIDLSTTTPPSGMSTAIDKVLYFSGTLATDVLLIVPNAKKTWIIHNNCVLSTFAFTMRTSGSAVTINIPNGGFTIVYCDGNNVLYRQDTALIGTLVLAPISVPAGTFLCNGASLLRSRWPDLFAVIGTTYGAADGLHFNLPDYVTGNLFLRCAGGSLALGTTQTSQNLSHTHNISGVPAVGTLTAAAGGAHTPTGSVASTVNSDSGTKRLVNNVSVGPLGYGGTASGGNISSSDMTVTSTFTGDAVGTHTHNVTGTLTAGTLAVGTTGSGGTEARPANVAVNFCIKY